MATGSIVMIVVLGVSVGIPIAKSLIGWIAKKRAQGKK